MNDYHAFIASKKLRVDSFGFESNDLNQHLFPFQAEIVRYALRKGRAALFVDTGLGKTLMQLDWARAVHERTNGDILILTPLAVAAQMAREAQKFGIEARVVRDASECGRGINIANYERLQKLDLSRFVGVSLDESSILKSSLDQWQQWASLVWMDIQQTNVLNGKVARVSEDEKHICPLQLDLIERALVLWSNPGDVVFSPFMGIGSEGYMAVKAGRKFIGTELKPEYWQQACGFLQAAEQEGQDLFAAQS